MRYKPEKFLFPYEPDNKPLKLKYPEDEVLWKTYFDGRYRLIAFLTSSIYKNRPLYLYAVKDEKEIIRLGEGENAQAIEAEFRLQKYNSASLLHREFEHAH